MSTRLTMPQLGESVVEGTVIEWLKQEGETVEEYDPVVIIGTDKVDSDIPAPASGTLLKIYVREGETVEAGTLLALIGDAGENTPDADSERASGRNDQEDEEMPAAVAESAPSDVDQQSGGAHVTPVVARMAAAHNLDLSRIKGTGRGGRITKKDVQMILDRQEQSVEADDEVPPWEQPGSGDLFKSTADYEDEPESDMPAPPAQRTKAQPASAPANVPGELLPLNAMRRSIAEHMVHSKHTSPHVTTVFEVDLSSVVAHRSAHRAGFERQGVRLTFTPYFVAASVAALRQHPQVNVQWTDDGIFVHHAVNIGVAVALDDGLLVPVIKDAHEYNLTGLARQVNDLADRARRRQLKPDEVQGGTFTITNHGVTGSLFATPIINQPQVAILGVGKLEKRVKVINDAIAIRPCLFLSLTFDHRVLDGAAADGFMQSLVNALESWR